MPKIKPSRGLDNEVKILAEELNGNLSAGNQTLFNSIEKLGLQEFTTQDIYQFKSQFSGKTPENTIRRNLQELRDIGLLEFIERGVYKKLWQ
jgi:Fic family protein